MTDTIHSPYFTGTADGHRIELSMTRERLADDDNVEEFGDELLSACSPARCAGERCQILIDVGPLKYATSSILGKFIMLHRRLDRGGGRLVLAAPGETLMDILGATKLTSFFRVADTVEAGRAMLDQGPDTPADAV